MSPYQISSLARPLDPKNYKTNLAVIIIILLTLIAYSFFHDQDGINLGSRLLVALTVAFNLFISWAFAREIDPDEPLAGFLGMALTLAAYLFNFHEVTYFLWLILLLLLFRISNRSTGLPAKWIDTLLIVILSGYLCFSIDWVVGLIAGLAFWIDFKSAEPLIRHGWASIVVFVIAMVSLILDPIPTGFTSENIWLVIGSVVLFVPYIITSLPVITFADATGEKLNNKRVQLTQILALFTVIMFVFWQGITGFLILMPLWATMLAVCIFRIIRMVQNLLTNRGS
ncbi:MAG: hypothetical protein ACOCXH_15475 [Cyclobacteriaceae bacterium]